MKHNINMRQIFSGILLILLACILIISGISCAQAPATTTAPKTTQAIVKRGNLSSVVSVDGNLNMPQAFTLSFGKPGDVRDVLVEEGDLVKKGQILARLDDTAERLGVRLANNDVQTTLANLYETVPRLPQFPVTLYDTNVVTSPTVTTIGTPTTTTVLNPPGTTLPTGGAVTTSTTKGDVTTITTTTTAVVIAAGTPVMIPGGATNVLTQGGATNVWINGTTTNVVTSPAPIAPGTVVPPGPITVGTTGMDTMGVGTIGIGDTMATATVTTTVTRDVTTVTRTSLEKPGFGYSWDNTNKTWIQYPNVPVGSSLTSGYSGYYPNYSVLISFAWAQGEVALARELFLSRQYDAAAQELIVATADLEDCLQIIQAAIDDPQSGLGNWAQFVSNDPVQIASLQIQSDQSDAIMYILELRKAIDQIKQGQADIGKVRALTAQKKYEEAAPLLEAFLGTMEETGRIVLLNVAVITKHNDTTVYGKNICSYLYGAADGNLNKAFDAVQKGGMNSTEFQNNLRIAQHEMALCNAILGTNDYVLQHGLLLKTEQQYKVDLQSKLVTLRDKQDDFINTVIMAPFDGTVVKVGVKKNDVLSAQDYSSKGTIQVVDTTQIKFEGTVDEIDILKVKRGQQANITVDAIPNKVFTGKVSFISPFGTADASKVVKFPVTILLDPSDVTLNGGLTATSQIIMSSAENVLLAPLAAVTASAGESYVNVVNQATGQVEKRKVTTGGKNSQFIEIVSGLNEGDKVEVEIKVSGAPVTKGFPGRPAGR